MINKLSIVILITLLSLNSYSQKYNLKLKINGTSCQDFGLALKHPEEIESLEIIFNAKNVPFPMETFLFKKLKKLVIEDFDSDKLPNEFGSLTDLEELLLEDNDVLRSLPESFGLLINLKKLELENNESLVEIPNVIYSLNKLEILTYSSIGSWEISPNIGNLKSLKELNLSFDLSYKHLVYVPESICRLSNLSSLRILSYTETDFRMNINNIITSTPEIKKCIETVIKFNYDKSLSSTSLVKINVQQTELTPIDFFDNINNYHRVPIWNGDDFCTTSTRLKSYCIFKNELYVVGNIRKIDNVDCEQVAKFDGISWKPVGDLKTMRQMMKQWGGVNTIIEFNGELLIGTKLDGVKKWNGTNWVNYGLEETGVSHFCIYKNQLYVGAFSIAGLMTRLVKLVGSVWKWDKMEFTDLHEIGDMVVFNDLMYMWSGEGYYSKGQPSFIEYGGNNNKIVEIDCPKDRVWKGDFRNGECDTKILKTLPFDKGIYIAHGEHSNKTGGVFYWDGKSKSINDLFTGEKSTSLVKFNNFLIASTFQDKIAVIEDGLIRKWIYLPFPDDKDSYVYDYPMLIVYKNKLLFTVSDIRHCRKF